jgi:YgiT-type zinc finger domain-containing protein
MSSEAWKETFEEQTVTYVIEQQGRVVIIENVPARVCRETGERLFAPETVERLQQIIWEQRKPIRVVETPVFEFASAQCHGNTAMNFSAESSPNKGMEPTR